MPISTISPHDLVAKKKQGEKLVLVDVRTPGEYQELRCQEARNLPLHDLNAAAFQSQYKAEAGPVYLLCKSGSRGKTACEQLLAAGCTHVINVEGGTLALAEAGFPIVRGKKTISLERQVRIAAGSLVLIGSMLTYWVHPYFLALPAFIGAGLVFAGVTDTCGMGMMLARMPWNRLKTNATCPVPQ